MGLMIFICIIVVFFASLSIIADIYEDDPSRYIYDEEGNVVDYDDAMY